MLSQDSIRLQPILFKEPLTTIASNYEGVSITGRVEDIICIGSLASPPSALYFRYFKTLCGFLGISSIWV